MSLPLLHAGRTNPGLSAALDLRFALDKSLTAYRGPTPSFSRASTGSYFDASGVLRYATVNILTYSENFSDASWLKNSTTISSDSVIAPDGKTTADTLTSTSSTAIHYLEKTGYTVSTVQYTISIFAKYGTHRYLQISANNESSGVYANFDLFSGVVGSVGASATSQITNVGGGWYRCSMTYTATNTASRPLLVMVSSSTAPRVESITLTSGDYFYIWGCQQEASSTVGTYCPTTSSANSAPRFNHTYNGTSWVSRGLLVEEQRTNLIRHSEDFANASWLKFDSTVSSNFAESPDGTTTADKNIPNTNNAPHGLYNSSAINISSGTQYTASLFAKASGYNFIFVVNNVNASSTNAGVCVNLTDGSQSNLGGAGTYSVVNVGNGWWRISCTATATSTNGYIEIYPRSTAGANASFAGNGTDGVLIWGAQLESGAFPTSYIGTTNSSVVRSADVCQITGGDFSGFWNQSEGSIAIDFDRIGLDGYQMPFRVNAPSSALYYYSFSGNEFYQIFGASTALTISGVSAANTPVKAAIAFKSNDTVLSRNGAAVLSPSSMGALPTNFDSINIGRETSGSYLNGHIARLRYYRKRLPNETLQLLSEPDPTLNLQFALNKSLTPVAGPAPSFSRASTGSYFDSTGTLKYVNVNLLTYSEQFDNAAWSERVGNTLYTNVAASPIGDMTADQLQLTSSGLYYQKKAYSTTGTHTFSVWLRSSSPTTTLIRLSNDAGTENSVVTCNVTTSWQRFSVTRNWSANPVNFYAGLDQRTVVGGPGTSTDVFIWGAQLELASSPTQYAKTEAFTTAGPRFDHAFSGGQWVSRGLLLEEQRTNLAQYSEDMTNAFWTKSTCTITANNTTAPDGNATADRVVESTGTVNAGVYTQNGISFTNGTTYTASAFVKANGRSILILYFQSSAHAASGRIAWFDIANGTTQVQSGVTASIINVGNGWYRISATATANNTAASGFGLLTVSTMGSIGGYTGDGSSGFFAWGLSCEAGAFPTSYIGTTSSSVVRSADVCQITGTSFNWMWNQGEGSVAIECDRISFPSTTSFAFEAYSDTSNKILLENDSSADYSSVRNLGTDVVAWTISPAVQPNISNKSALAYKANDFAWSRLGATPVTDTSGGVPYCNALAIGNRGAYGALYALNGHIAKLIYYPARLTNTKLQQLST